MKLVISVLSLCVLMMIPQGTMSNGPVIWKDCTKGSSIMKIEKMNIMPPKDVYPGQGFTVNTTFILDDVLTGGKVKVDIQYGVLHYATGVYDLCDKLKEAKLDCPLSKGTKHGMFEGRVPFPHGQFIFTINATTTSGDPVSCFTLQMNDNVVN